MVQDGLITKWKQDFWPAPMNCRSGHAHKPATLEDTEAIFVLLNALLGIATVILVVEILLHKLLTNDKYFTRVKLWQRLFLNTILGRRDVPTSDYSDSGNTTAKGE